MKQVALIVEDTPLWQDSFRALLQGKFDEVIVARSYGEAAATLNRHSKDLNIALGIVDIRLSKDQKDTSGLNVVYEFKKHEIPCIATSAFATADIVRTALKQGNVVDFFLKDSTSSLPLQEAITEATTRKISSPETVLRVLRKLLLFFLVPVAISLLFAILGFPTVIANTPLVIFVVLTLLSIAITNSKSTGPITSGLLKWLG